MEDRQKQVKHILFLKYEGSEDGRADVKGSAAKTGRADDNAKQRCDKTDEEGKEDGRMTVQKKQNA